LIDKALGKEKEQRWQTMQEMRAALLAVGQQLAAAGGQTTRLFPAELGAPARKRRLPVLVVTAVVAASLAALGVSRLWHWGFEPARTGRKDVVVGVGGAHEAVRTARALLSRYDRDANLDKAIALLEQSLAASPVHAPTHAALAMAYYFKGGATREEHWRRRALDAANRAVELDGQLAQSQVALGLARALGGDAQSARLAFERALELDPRSVDGHWHLGRMGLAAKDWDRARASLSAAINLDPSHWAAYTSLGTLHYQRGELDQAGAAWDRARQIAPDNVIVLRNLVALYDKLGRYEEAAAVIHAALEVQPSPGLYSNLGVLQFYEGRYGSAVEAFEKAIKSGSNNFRTWGNLADAQRWSPPHRAKAPESYGVAVGLVEKELARAPEDDSARASMAVYLAKLGRKQDALAQAGKVRSELPGIRFKLAIVRELSGDRAGALQALEEALRVHHPLREIEREPELIALRADPRYQKLVLGKR
jgi:tetratricopeptide (TPR) repeat protein